MTTMWCVHVWCEFIMNELLPDRNLGSGQAGSRKLEELADRAAGKQVEAVRHGPMVELACRVAVYDACEPPSRTWQSAVSSSAEMMRRRRRPGKGLAGFFAPPTPRPHSWDRDAPMVRRRDTHTMN